MIGEDALVPPYTCQPELPWYGVESYTATPVLGSATAETSAVALPEHCVALVCQLGFALSVEQPLPAPLHAVSLQPRVLLALRRLVPPTATTCGKLAGDSMP